MAESLQYIRTDKAIQQALIRLLKEKPFEKIIVQDILDETPVTRSTFYKHYHDIYEVAERMQDDYLKFMDEVFSEEEHGPLFDDKDVIWSNYRKVRELMEALEKIHTEKVDIFRALTERFQKVYLATSNSPGRELESIIFAYALAAYQMNIKPESPEFFSEGYINTIFINVAMRILRLSNDPKSAEMLISRIQSMKEESNYPNDAH